MFLCSTTQLSIKLNEKKTISKKQLHFLNEFTNKLKHETSVHKQWLFLCDTIFEKILCRKLATPEYVKS